MAATLVLPYPTVSLPQGHNLAVWFDYDVGNERGESAKGSLPAVYVEDRPLELQLITQLYAAGFGPGSYRGQVRLQQATAWASWEGHKRVPVAVEPGPHQVEFELPDSGHEGLFAEFRRVALQHSLRLKVTKNLWFTTGAHGHWPASWGFRAVFSDPDKNRLELAACRQYRDWALREPADGRLSWVVIDLAVGGKKLVAGTVGFDEWPAKLQLFCDHLETLRRMNEFRRALLNMTR